MSTWFVDDDEDSLGFLRRSLERPFPAALWIERGKGSWPTEGSFTPLKTKSTKGFLRARSPHFCLASCTNLSGLKFERKCNIYGSCIMAENQHNYKKKFFRGIWQLYGLWLWPIKNNILYSKHFFIVEFEVRVECKVSYKNYCFYCFTIFNSWWLVWLVMLD